MVELCRVQYIQCFGMRKKIQIRSNEIAPKLQNMSVKEPYTGQIFGCTIIVLPLIIEQKISEKKTKKTVLSMNDF